GGQPQPPYQPGGQLASPLQASMQTPTQASFNHMGATAMEPDAAAVRAAQIAQARQAVQASQPGQLGQEQPGRQADFDPNQTQTQSNGWTVVKTTDDPNAPAQPQQAQAQSPVQPM